jgi:hypothetical protein
MLALVSSLISTDGLAPTSARRIVAVRADRGACEAGAAAQDFGGSKQKCGAHPTRL